jgi:hypothetical protein
MYDIPLVPGMLNFLIDRISTPLNQASRIYPSQIYPFVDFGAVGHIELTFPHILRFSFEFVSTVGMTVERLVRVRN